MCLCVCVKERERERLWKNHVTDWQLGDFMWHQWHGNSMFTTLGLWAWRQRINLFYILLRKRGGSLVASKAPQREPSLAPKMYSEYMPVPPGISLPLIVMVGMNIPCKLFWCKFWFLKAKQGGRRSNVEHLVYPKHLHNT